MKENNNNKNNKNIHLSYYAEARKRLKKDFSNWQMASWKVKGFEEPNFQHLKEFIFFNKLKIRAAY